MTSEIERIELEARPYREANGRRDPATAQQLPRYSATAGGVTLNKDKRPGWVARVVRWWRGGR